MISLIDLKHRIRDVLVEAGISESESRAESDIITEYVSNLSAAEQVIFDDDVPEQWLADVELIIDKRVERMPLQYILERCDFMGLTLAVKKGVFIPRADTETVVETALKIIFDQKIKKPKIADIGSGSGAIAVCLAKAIPDAQVYAIEISDTAFEISKLNAENHGVANRIEFIRGDWRGALPNDLNMVVSNPPYIPRSKAKELPPEVVDHEPAKALFGVDRDGLGHYRDFARLLTPHFTDSGGYVCLEVGDNQAGAVAQIFEDRGWVNVKQTLDLNKKPRALSAWSPKKTDVKKT
jgi:release factor glutamine methyltransferase